MSEWITDRPPETYEVREGETTMVTLRNKVVVSWSGPTLRAEWGKPGEVYPIAWMIRPEPYTPPEPAYRCPVCGGKAGIMEAGLQWKATCLSTYEACWGAKWRDTKAAALADVQKLCKQEPVEPEPDDMPEEIFAWPGDEGYGVTRGWCPAKHATLPATGVRYVKRRTVRLDADGQCECGWLVGWRAYRHCPSCGGYIEWSDS